MTGTLSKVVCCGGILAFLRFEDLKVFQLADKLADEVWNIVIAWKYFEKDTVGKQLVEVAGSIGANIAEGAGKGTYKDYKRFVRDELGPSLNAYLKSIGSNKRQISNTKH